MRQYIVGLLTVVLVLAGMTWWAFAWDFQPQIDSELERRGYEPVFAEPETFSWSMTLKPEEYMADTAVEESYNMSCTLKIMNQDQSPMMTSAALSSIAVRGCGVMLDVIDITTAGGWPTGIVPDGESPGGDGFVYRIAACWDEAMDTASTGQPYIWVGASNGWENSVTLACVVEESHIDRTQALNVHMGSDAGPTHSNERYFSDGWETNSDEKHMESVMVWENGSYTFTDKDPADYPEFIPPSYAPEAPPNASIIFDAEMHKSAAGDIQYGAWEDIQCSNVELNLSGVYEDWGSGNFRTEGDGSELQIWHRDPNVTFAGSYTWTNSFKPPYILDLTEIGLVDFEETVHNPKYDDILVWIYDGYAVCPEWQAGGDCNPPPGYYPLAPYEWGGASPTFTVGINPLDMICPYCGSQLRPNSTRRVPYINADYPDTSETDWISAGEFAEGTACPITIGDMYTVFNPYVQRVSPFSGWDMDADYATEFWAPVSGNIVILLDRTSARTGVTA